MNKDLIEYLEKHTEAHENYLELLELKSSGYYVLEVRDEKRDIVCYTYTDNPGLLYERAFEDRPQESYDPATGRLERKTQAHSYYIPQVLYRDGYYTMHCYKYCGQDKTLARNLSRDLTAQNNSLAHEERKNRKISSLDEQLFA